MSRTERSKIKGRRSLQSTQGPSLPDSSTSAVVEALLRGFKQPSQCQVGKPSAAKLKMDHYITAPHGHRSTRNTKMSHYRREIPSSSKHRGLDSGRSTTPSSHPNPAIRSRHCSVPQRSAEGQLTSLQHKWKHEIQIALLRRKAAMTRAVLPHTSARSKWHLAGLLDRVASHWIRARPLDGGDDDEDADEETDTTVPGDDNDDIASFNSQHTTAIQTSNL